MQMTSLIIAPQQSYRAPAPDNPMRAVVKLASDNSVVECVLSDETMRKLVDLCAAEIARDAAEKLAEFCQQVATLDADAGPALIGEG